jgi:hypothetical protein
MAEWYTAYCALRLACAYCLSVCSTCDVSVQCTDMSSIVGQCQKVCQCTCVQRYVDNISASLSSCCVTIHAAVTPRARCRRTHADNEQLETATTLTNTAVTASRRLQLQLVSPLLLPYY